MYLALPAALLLALVWVAATGADNGLAPVTPHSSNAESIRSTYFLILGITGGIFLLVEAALLLFVFRFRSRGRARAQEGAQIHGATSLEIASTVVPVLILAAIAAFVFVKLPSIKNVPPATAGSRAIDVRVEGHQYYWQFVYPGGQVSIKRMVVPAGQVVTIDIVSADVVTAGGCRPSEGRPTRSRGGPTTRGSGPTRPGATRSAAPSSAASSTHT